MIASILTLPHGLPDRDPAIMDQVGAIPGLMHAYLLTPGEGDGDHLAVLLWRTEQDLDAYIESDLGQQALAGNPRATRTVYTVEEIK